MRWAYKAKRIFTGEAWLQDHILMVEGDTITGLVPDNDEQNAVVFFEDCLLVPALIDLQIYGAYGKLLAAEPQKESIQSIYDYSKAGGAAFCLPTVATNSLEVFHQCIDAAGKYQAEGGKGVPGLHLEGPWINPIKRGAHAENFIHPPTLEEVARLIDYGAGLIRMITLAPEICSEEVLKLIAGKGIIISAGHSNASYGEAMYSFSQGVSCVTHLFNAMSPMQHRAPGLAGAAMDHQGIMTSIIPDGYHVDYAAIRIAKKAMNDCLYAITDAVTETRKGIYHHTLNEDRYEANGILSGSALTMIKAVRNLVQHVGISLDEALRMCSYYPAKVLGMENELGKIAPGYKAKLLVLDEKLEIVRVID